jgi:hypothetical protein
MVVTDAKGDDFRASHKVLTSVELTPLHRVWPPGADTTNTAKALRVGKVNAEVNGRGIIVFYEVILGA